MVARHYTDVLTSHIPAEWFQPVPSRALWLPAHAFVAALCTFAIVNAHLGMAARLGLSSVIGVSFTCIGILGHEVMHGSVVESLWLRRLLGAICLAPFGIGAGFWTVWHNIHHANTQDPARDPDVWGTATISPTDPAMGLLRPLIHPRTLLFPFLLATGVTAHATTLLLSGQARMTPKQRAVTRIEFLLLWAFWLSLGFWLGWSNFLFFFVVPLLLTNLIANSFVVTNHSLNPLDDDTGDPLAGSLTVTTYRWLSRLFLNFNYHTEHHLFPRMNPKYAPQISRMLKENWPDRYHQMPHGRALLAVWRTPRIYHDRTKLIDARDRTLYPTLGNGLEREGVLSHETTRRASQN